MLLNHRQNLTLGSLHGCETLKVLRQKKNEGVCTVRVREKGCGQGLRGTV